MRLTDDVARRLLPGHRPLLCAADPQDLAVRRRLERAWARGDLVRLAPRVYLPVTEWTALTPWDRTTVGVAALALARPDMVFTGLTAAALHGLPVAVVPPSVELRASSPGHRGARPLVPRAVSPALHGQEPRLPALPRRRPRWGLPAAPDAAAERVEVRLSDGRRLGTALADPLPTLLAVLGAHTPFHDAVAPLDVLVRDHPADVARWAGCAEQVLGSQAAVRRLRRAVAFADGRAESAGESCIRALIHELGSAAPTSLQQRHRDATGREVARTDFWWEQVGVAGEFDGLGKYDLPLHGGDEASRRSAIRREKEGEVALQLVTRGVAHWTWADLRQPERLARILAAHGIPRASPAARSATVPRSASAAHPADRAPTT